MVTAQTKSSPAQKRRADRNWSRPCKHRRMLALCLVLFSALAACSSQEASPQYTIGDVVFRDHLLPNRGRVVAFSPKDFTNGNMVSISVIFRAGAKYTPPGMKGLAHFVEHIVATDALRKCTPGPQPFMSARVVASTLYDSVTYTLIFEYESEVVAANNIELFKNSLFSPSIASEQVEYEKGVVESESFLIQTKEIFQLTGIVTHFVNDSTGLGKDVCGTRESLVSVKEEDVQKYVKAHHSIDSAVILVSASSPDTAHAIAQTIEAFSELEPREKEEGEEEGPLPAKRKKANPESPTPQPPTLLSAQTPISPISPALQNKILVLKSVSFQGSAYKKMLVVNIFMPPVCFIQEEAVLSHIENIFSGTNFQNSSLLKSLEGYVCKLSLSRDLATMSFWSEKSAASVCIRLFLTNYGEKNLGAVLATVEEYAREIRMFVEENVEKFKRTVLLTAYKSVVKTTNKILGSHWALEMFDGMVVRGSGFEATEQLMNAVEEWKEGEYRGMPGGYPGEEALDDYIDAVLERMADRSFWAISRISVEGSFERRVPYLINEEGRVEDWPEVSDKERTAIENVVHRHFAWCFRRSEDGSTLLRHFSIADELSGGHKKEFVSKLEKYPKEVSLKSLSDSFCTLSPEDLAALDVKKEETKTTITTVAAPLRKMEFSWSSSSSNPPPVQSCTLLLYTRAVQPDPQSAAASILHAVAALTRFTDRYSEGIRRHADLSYEADWDGNLVIKLRASDASSDKDYSRASLQQFLDIYRSDEVYTEKETDVAKNLAICAILEKCEKKEKYDFSTQRFTSALSTSLDLREVLEAMDTVPSRDIAGAHVKAFEVSFENFASFAESCGVYADILEAFCIKETESFLREKKKVDEVWNELWSIEGRKSIEIHRTTSEIKKNHVFLGIPIPPTVSKDLFNQLENYCLRMNNYFNFDFIQPKLPVYYGYLYLYRVPIPPFSPQRYLLCFEVSGMASTDDIVSAIQDFLSKGTEYYIQHVFPITSPITAFSESEREGLLDEFKSLFNATGTLVITESSSPE